MPRLRSLGWLAAVMVAAVAAVLWADYDARNTVALVSACPQSMVQGQIVDAIWDIGDGNQSSFRDSRERIDGPVFACTVTNFGRASASLVTLHLPYTHMNYTSCDVWGHMDPSKQGPEDARVQDVHINHISAGATYTIAVRSTASHYIFVFPAHTASYRSPDESSPREHQVRWSSRGSMTVFPPSLFNREEVRRCWRPYAKPTEHL